MTWSLSVTLAACACQKSHRNGGEAAPLVRTDADGRHVHETPPEDEHDAEADRPALAGDHDNVMPGRPVVVDELTGEPVVQGQSVRYDAGIPRCAPGMGAVTMATFNRDRHLLLGRQVQVQGPLRIASMGCTEAACGNSCNFELVVGHGRPDVGGAILLRHQDAWEPDGDFSCAASAGDPCDRPSWDPGPPPCGRHARGQTVIASGVLASWADLGDDCGPDCRAPIALKNAQLCVP